MEIPTNGIRQKGAPRGEARRLRYFTVISKKLLESPSIDIDLFLEKIVFATERNNIFLDTYIRQTGVLRSKAVAKNYLSFAEWLGFLKIESRLVIPNSFTVFLANLSEKDDFNLTLSEKLTFFKRFIEIDDFRLVIAKLTDRSFNFIKDLIKSVNKSEHFIESYIEWLVDLEILRPQQSKFGPYTITKLGNEVSREITNGQDAFVVYARGLGVSINSEKEPTEDGIWRALNQSLEKLANLIRSEVNPSLFSGEPLVLDIQLGLIINQGIILSKEEIIKRLKVTSANHNAVFTWDSLADAGYLLISR